MFLSSFIFVVPLTPAPQPPLSGNLLIVIMVVVGSSAALRGACKCWSESLVLWYRVRDGTRRCGESPSPWYVVGGEGVGKVSKCCEHDRFV